MAIASRGKDDEDGGCYGDVERPGKNVGGSRSFSTMVETSARGGNENEDGGRSGDLGEGEGKIMVVDIPQKEMSVVDLSL
jgi:hypothetical protein